DVRIDPWEREEVGDVAGKTLLHVQCHFGLDTLSWARLGAVVTGVDFSEAAIGFARELADETGLATGSRFVLSNVYDLPEALAGKYADRDAVVDAEWEHGWNHSLGETVTALARNGLRIEFLDEKRTVGWPVDWLTELEDDTYGFPPDQAGTMPLMFSLRARR